MVSAPSDCAPIAETVRAGHGSGHRAALGTLQPMGTPTTKFPVVLEPGENFRWFGETPDGRRSSSWGLWVARNSPDVYLGHRALGGREGSVSTRRVGLLKSESSPRPRATSASSTRTSLMSGSSRVSVDIWMPGREGPSPFPGGRGPVRCGTFLAPRCGISRRRE